MKTHYYTATSIDGRIADEHDSLTWLFQFGSDPGVDDRYETFVAGVGALVMGSTTYEWLLREEIRDDPTRWPYAQPTDMGGSEATSGPCGEQCGCSPAGTCRRSRARTCGS